MLRIALLLALAGCASPTSPGPLPVESAESITIVPTASGYAPGDTAHLTIRNNEPYAVTFSLCLAARIERRVGETWVEVPYVRTCESQGSGIGANGTAAATFYLPPSTPEGMLRLRVLFQVLQQPQSIIRRSSPFTVQRTAGAG